MLHGPSHSTEECRILKKYFSKYSAQRPHIEREARSGAVNFDGTIEEVNSMADHDAPIPCKTRGVIEHKILIVTRTLQFQKRRNAFMGLTA